MRIEYSSDIRGDVLLDIRSDYGLNRNLTLKFRRIEKDIFDKKYPNSDKIVLIDEETVITDFVEIKNILSSSSFLEQAVKDPDVYNIERAMR